VSGELRLLRRGAEFSIRLRARRELMYSSLKRVREALAKMACGEESDTHAQRLLIGGLDGLQLRAALFSLGRMCYAVATGTRWQMGRTVQ